MKNIFFLILISLSFQLFAQQAPFIDFNRFFKTFYKGNFRQLEFQPIRSYEGSDQLTCYIDSRGDFKVYDGEEVIPLSNQIVKYQLGDYLLAWNIGPALFYLDKKEKKLLTTFGNRYEVRDSLLVYEDTRYNSVSVLYKNKTRELYQMVGDLRMPISYGDNIFVLKDNGDYYKFFWRDSIYDFDVYNRPIQFSCGRDILCFNDPINQSFTAFDHGELIDLEANFVKKYEAGRGFLAYQDQQGNLWHYQGGEKQKLSSYTADNWEVRDDMIIWMENSFLYVLENGKKKQLLNYVPKDYKIKNKVFVFRNLMGGVSVYFNGKTHELTKQLNASYEIFGNTVLVQLFNSSFLVFNEGKTYSY
ncbi:MAG: hypothetical protein EP338_06840 [Bacteroidetes bacterium]|nr:MAG: hypothetical protein EP338_06840 [Bacteroidota bacterium]